MCAVVQKQETVHSSWHTNLSVSATSCLFLCCFPALLVSPPLRGRVDKESSLRQASNSLVIFTFYFFFPLSTSTVHRIALAPQEGDCFLQCESFTRQLHGLIYTYSGWVFQPDFPFSHISSLIPPNLLTAS